MEDKIHAGHRKRVREEFLEQGFSKSTPPHKILELLLFYCIPQKDTNPLAHELISRYKTLQEVFNAPVEELIAFKGITRNNVVLLKLIPELLKCYVSNDDDKTFVFRSIDEIGAYLCRRYLMVTDEEFGIVCLDASGKLRSFEILMKGDIASVGVSIRKVVETAIRAKAKMVVMVHNHPSGIALPSNGDVAVTEMVADALSHIDIELIDHIVIGDAKNNDFISMAQSEAYTELFHSK